MNSILITILLVLFVLFIKIENSYFFQLTLLHSNNINFCFEENADNTGGAARVLYYVNKYRKEAKEGNGPSVIYVNAGDNFSAIKYNTANQSNIIADYLNLLNSDAMCLGNHELNAGAEDLTRFLQHLQVPVITANINFGQQHVLQKYITPSRILQIKKHKIGIVGVTTARRRIPFLPKSVSITDEIQSLQTECSKLHNLGVNIIIVLSHAGAEVDKLIAKAVDHVDVVVGCVEQYGRRGRRYQDVIKRKDGKYVPIIRDGSRMTSLGVFNIEFNSRGDVTKYKGRSIFLHSGIPQDVDALKLALKPLERFTSLGVTVVALDSDCRVNECNFGHLVADAMVEYKRTAYQRNTKNRKGWTNYPIAIVHAGALMRRVRRSTEMTDDTIRRHVLYDDTLVLQRLTGLQLENAIVEGTEYYGYSRGYFMQFSGIHVQYNLTKLEKERLLKIYVRCGECQIPSYSPLEPDKEYNIIVNFKTYININTFQDLKAPEMDLHLLGLITAKFMKKYPRIYAEADDRIMVLAEAGKFRVLPLYIYLMHIIVFLIN